MGSTLSEALEGYVNLKEACSRHGFIPAGIIHIGASMLEEAPLYQEMGVPLVIWVEALPKSEERYMVAQHYKHVLYEGLAFSDVDENTEFHVASNNVSSSLLPLAEHSRIYPDIRYVKDIPIRTRRADEFFGPHFPHVDTLVLDVQGMELRVLKGFGDILKRIQRILTEVHLVELYSGSPKYDELRHWLADQGFSNWEFTPQHQGVFGDAFAWR